VSLKAFHIFFIVASTILAFGFGGWAVYVYVLRSGETFLAMGLASLVVGGVLVYYGYYVLEKLRDL
jgi:hypothetical protein